MFHSYFFFFILFHWNRNINNQPGRIFSICFLERRKGGVSNRRTECVGRRRHVSAWAIEPWETLISSFVSYWKTFIAPQYEREKIPSRSVAGSIYQKILYTFFQLPWYLPSICLVLWLSFRVGIPYLLV